ncbi:type II secretion system minor pseudopilin GspJ [Sideroxydans lithotrophicus]|uniref:Type II secretion system protein J n=1 Tax=Sideroxydans lithotrophicus (strain ES-1) TaxID=580332 RepID=D5CMB9_SIDLE|nr:type II secretion system minor pseudopilin GspJ [Sideroxydans lithotrophicus]ADE10733.1 general secretion pathway protein J [Sideroxydans lithotrophicus ES-1]
MTVRTIRGFTLIELLVALFVFAILAVTAYRGLNAVSQTRDRTGQETRKWQSLDRFFARLDGETAQVLQRPVRTANGAEAPAFAGTQFATGSLEDVQLAFTRSGGIDADGVPLPPQRIGYRLRQNRLELLRWTALDSAPYNVPSVDTLLEDVSEFNLRYLNSRLTWEKQWPPAVADAALPREVEVELVLKSGEKLTRFFSLR